jgi:LAGLIDADG DNA endonuclease family protein
LAYSFNNLYNKSIDSAIVSFSDGTATFMTPMWPTYVAQTENIINHLLLSIPLIKSKRLKKTEKEAIALTSELKDILVGLLLGDLHGRLRYGKVSFVFKQGIIHQDYLNHLYGLFSHYCPSPPKIVEGLPDIRTGKIYFSIVFQTYTLPCFIELYNSFYIKGKKIIPLNIEDLLTPISLAYWIADDGSWIFEQGK